MSARRTTCPYCGVGCGLIAASDRVAPDPDHPANLGRVCSKGAALDETLGLEDRLLHSEIGGTRARWDTALDLVAQRFRAAIAEHGPDAVALYVSGQFLTEDYYVANKLMKGFVGSANIDTNSRLCMASSVAGHVRAFGADVVPGCYEDWEAADLVVLIGTNTAWCHPVLYQRLMAARATRGTRIVVIDPRRTATAEMADLHLPIAPGSDTALFNGLLAHIAANGALAADWVATHTSGLEAALDAVRSEDVAALTGLPPGDLRRFYDWFAGTERVVTGYGQGVNQSACGTDKVNAIVNCHLATGRIGRPGMGPFSLTGQPNAMGGREVGGLANQLAAHMGFSDPDDIDRVRRFWNAPNIATRPGLKAVELFDAVLDGRIKALWVLGTNPAASMPRAGRVQAALDACPFTVVSEISRRSDTLRHADVALPALGWGEKDGTVTNSERRISRQRAFLPPPGEARADWWMLAEFGKRLGWADAFSFAGPAAIFREHAALSGFENGGTRAFDIGACATLDDDGYEGLVPIQWPARQGVSSELARLFAGGGFFTADRRARFVPTPHRPTAERTDDLYPFLLNTGRVRDQWHTMTRTGRVARLMRHEDEPYLALAEPDAARLGITAGSLVRISSRHGGAILRARPSAGQRPGELFAPMHWGAWFCSSGAVDRLVGAATDPISGQPELKATAVRVAPVETRWRGLLLRRRAEAITGDFYWARMAQEEGEAFVLAGWEALPTGSDLDRFIADLLDGSGDRLDYRDATRGIFRAAIIAGDDRVESCLFLARDAAGLPDRDEVAALMQKPLARAARAQLLSGRGAVAATECGGQTVCSCFSVGLATIERRIANDGLTTPAEIGKALKAGTNCGSCVPELEAILRGMRATAAA